MQYLEVIEKTINYIENNLDSDITVSDIAKAVGYSYYHLSHIFPIYTHESLGYYLTYRKLDFAARQLVNTNKKIIDIATELGFKSNEAFTRAFKKRYRISPYNYRKQGKYFYLYKKIDLDQIMLLHIQNHLEILPKYEMIEDIKVVGISHINSIKNNTLKIAWENFYRITSNIDNLKNNRCFCICNTNTSYYNENQDAVYTSMIATEMTSENINYPSCIQKKIIKGGKFLIFTHKGSLKDLKLTYAFIWGHKLLHSNYKFDDSRNDFELYDQRFKGYDNNNTEIDIYIPIK